MTDMEPETPGPLLLHMRRQNEELREQIALEVARMNGTDLQAVLRMIGHWKAQSQFREAMTGEQWLSKLPRAAQKGESND